MATPIPINGGILVGQETTYGTEASSKTAIHGVSSTLGLRRGTAKSRARPTISAQQLKQMPASIDGEVSASMTFTDSVITDLLGAYSTPTGTTTKAYAIGTGVTPECESLSWAINHGGLEYTYTGCVVSGLTLEFPADSDALITVPCTGKAVAKEATPTTITLPSESYIVMPDSFGTLTADSDVLDFQNFQVRVDIPLTIKGASYAGAATVRRVCWAGGMTVSGSITVDLDDDDTANMNTVAYLDSYIADGDLGAITLMNGLTGVSLASCQMVGDPPSYDTGDGTFPINFEAESLTIFTDAS